jgi:hypothetical protein
VKKFDQKACVPITKRHEFIGQALGDRQARVVAPQILIVLFLIYLFDNIIQLIFLRSLWYYGGW